MFSLVFRAIRVASPTPPILQATQQATCEESTSPLHPVILPDHLFYPLGPLVMDCADLLLSFSPVFPTAAFLPFPFLSLLGSCDWGCSHPIHNLLPSSVDVETIAGDPSTSETPLVSLSW